MNETARSQNISIGIYSPSNIWDHYNNNIRPFYDDLYPKDGTVSEASSDSSGYIMYQWPQSTKWMELKRE